MRLLHCGNAHLARFGDVLRLVLHSIGEPPRSNRGNHPASEPGVDRADRAERDIGVFRISSYLPVCVARSRHEVLRLVSASAVCRWSEDHYTPTTKPQSKCIRGTVGALSQAGVPFQGDSVRRRLVVTSFDRIQHTLSPREEPSGEAESVAVPVRRNAASKLGAVPPAAGRAPQVLRECRVKQPHPGAAATPFRGEVVAVKAGIRLLRSFDQVSHQYLGYTLVLAVQDSPEGLRVAIGPAAHAKFQFRIGDIISGQGHPVLDPKQEWANLYKASRLQVERRGPTEQDRPADPDGGIAPPLEVYRANGHRRLDPRTCQSQCTPCPWARWL